MGLISKDKLAEIVELSESVPDAFQVKCFEILLSHAVEPAPPSRTPQAQREGEEQKASEGEPEFVLPIDVKAFLTQYGLSPQLLWQLFLVESGEIRPVYQLNTTKMAEAQVHHTLMMSLENALLTGEFKAKVEAVRERCRDRKLYDSNNFLRNFRSRDTLFRDPDDTEELVLTPDGKAELANLLEELSS